jgi:hypothetical protein
VSQDFQLRRCKWERNLQVRVKAEDQSQQVLEERENKLKTQQKWTATLATWQHFMKD